MIYYFLTSRESDFSELENHPLSYRTPVSISYKNIITFTYVLFYDQCPFVQCTHTEKYLLNGDGKRNEIN